MSRSAVAFSAALVAVLAAACALAAGPVGAATAGVRSGAPRGRAVSAGAARALTVTIGGDAPAAAVPNAFLGISTEITDLTRYAGTSTSNLDGPFIALLRNLGTGGTPILRLAGDSSDWSWWPIPGDRQPGMRYALTPEWTSVAKAVAQQFGGKLMVGLNLEADSARLTRYELTQLRARLGSTVYAYELGNEPELYSAYAWYHTKSGASVFGRPPGYGIGAFTSDWGRIAASLPAAPLAGPSTGSQTFFDGLPEYLARDHRRLSLVTVHAYPLKRCVRTQVNAPSALLAPSSLGGLVAGLHSVLADAGRYRLPVRLDELNGVTCGGEPGVSNSFAEALWALNVLPLLERAGVTGVNFHTVPGTSQALISASHTGRSWQVAVQPEYYGMVMFAAAAPSGARFLRVGLPSEPGLLGWATRTSAGVVHVVLTNASRSSRTLDVDIPGESAAASTVALSARSIDATSGVTLGGRTFLGRTGQLSGAPTVSTISPAAGSYAVTVPASSAVVLSVGA